MQKAVSDQNLEIHATLNPNCVMVSKNLIAANLTWLFYNWIADSRHEYSKFVILNGESIIEPCNAPTQASLKGESKWKLQNLVREILERRED